MPRSTNAPASRDRRRKIIKRAKGYRGSRHRLLKTAKQAVDHAGVYAYRDRRVKKRMFRRLWNVRINAAARLNGLSYSRLIHGLSQADVAIDRKILASLAIHDSDAFAAVVDVAKHKLAA